MAWDGRTGTGCRCPSCRARVLTQWVGAVAAVKVTASLTPLTAAQQAEARTPDRLIWCLYQATAHSPARLRWITASHPANCRQPHVAEHQCPGPEPTTLF